MPTFEVEVYELHTNKWEVEAADEAAAIIAVSQGQGRVMDDSQEFVESAARYGMELITAPAIKLAEELISRGADRLVGESHIAGIREIELTED